MFLQTGKYIEVYRLSDVVELHFICSLTFLGKYGIWGRFSLEIVNFSMDFECEFILFLVTFCA